MSDGRTAQAAAAAVERWELPEISGPVVGLTDPRRQQDDEARQAALQRAEARGYETGLQRAQREIDERIAMLQERIEHLDALFNVLARPLEQLDEEVEGDLLQLALAVGKQLARRELRVEPTQIIAIVRESLAQLPIAAREVRVHVHPQDAATIREHLSSGSGERAWALVEDPTLACGGCLVQSETSRVDARFESRVAAIAADAFGEERASERETSRERP